MVDFHPFAMNGSETVFNWKSDDMKQMKLYDLTA